MIPPALQAILTAIQRASIEIQHQVRYHALTHPSTTHPSAQQNASGDVQERLDLVANHILIAHVTESNACNVLLSEENEHPIHVPAAHRGTYLVAFDPLDGSSNIQCNAPVGTIFSIYDNQTNAILPPTTHLQAAGYVLYGPATELIVATRAHPHPQRYLLSPSNTYEHVGSLIFPTKGKAIYSINEGNQSNWYPDTKRWIDGYKAPGANYASRYIGSMVADVHRTLLYGGVFCYPADKKNPNGKLRLLYECIPMAYLAEAAGGQAIAPESTQRILDIAPTAIHQRSPILLGSKQEVTTYRLRAKL